MSWRQKENAHLCLIDPESYCPNCNQTGWSYVGDRGDKGRGCVGAIPVGNVDTDLTCRVHFITVPPPEAQVCVPVPPVSSRGLDELHLGKWMLLISTLGCTDHLKKQQGSDQTA